MITIPSDDHIAAMTAAQLVATFNALSTSPVRRFADRKAGVKRVMALAQAQRIADAGKVAMFKEPWESAPKAAPKKGPTPGDEGIAAVKRDDAARAKPAVPANSSATRGGKPTISGRCYELIGQGLDDAAIWAVIQPEFGLTDKQKNYPKLNRQHYVRRGLG